MLAVCGEAHPPKSATTLQKLDDVGLGPSSSKDVQRRVPQSRLFSPRLL